MEKECANKMAKAPIKRLVWSMGLPMVLSMVLQALYNIVDTAFVINMEGGQGQLANLALTYAFPVQIFMIAMGVGIGIGINALLSTNLGQGEEEKVAKAAGNGITLGAAFYLLFLLFGLFLAEPFISMQASGIADESDKAEVIKMGTEYLRICCTLSLGQMMFTVYERFLQATGMTLASTLGQIAGALTNIALDYVFIYPLKMGVVGAALATVIGQFVSFAFDAAWHYARNKEVKNGFHYLKPDLMTTASIVKIGIPAMIMQALLSVMMLGVNLLLSFARFDAEILQGSFGIYYKIQQIALFACFGLSNALITIVSFNYGAGDHKRVYETAKYGLLAITFVALAIVTVYEAFANPIATLFGLASGEAGEEIVSVTALAIRIGSAGFLFMALLVGMQGLLQGTGSVYAPLLISLLRLVVFVFPFVFLFSQLEGSKTLLWLSFPLAEILAMAMSLPLFLMIYKKKLSLLSVERNREEAN